MPHDVGIGQVSESLTRNNSSPWAWLFEVHLGASEVAYLTPNNESVTYLGVTYYPYPMTVPTVPEEQGTVLAQLELTVYQIDSMLTDRLYAGEVVGQRCIARLVHLDHLTETDIIEHETAILGAEVMRESRSVTFTLGQASWLNKLVGRRFLRLRCHHVFGSSSCGYDTARSGALSTCSRLYSDGSNGCVEHGDEEESLGLFRLHPARFGGFPGLPRQNRG